MRIPRFVHTGVLVAGCLFLLAVQTVIHRASSDDTDSNSTPSNSVAAVPLVDGVEIEDGNVNSQPVDQPILTPEQALAALRVPEGFRATLFAAEPDVQQPIGMCFDERGRLWVAENYTYAESGVNFDLRYRDRIIILEDVDGDGVHDNRTVFWDQGQKLTSVQVGFGGVWALCAPHLLFIPDRDRDDVPDGPPEVILDGWDADAVRHNIVSNLTWGPDGWLYGQHGILATSYVGAPGTPDPERVPINCGVWRYHPTRKVFEAVAHGTTNPWGMDFDQYGELFMINTVIGHFWHVPHGAHWQRMYGVDFNPHLYELMEQTADHYHWDTGEAWNDIRNGMSATTDAAGGGHAHCGMMIYLGDNWPEEYYGGVFALNMHGRRINHDSLELLGDNGEGAYVARHQPDMIFSDDVWFRGITLTYGPDGGVYIADWSDIGECHENDGVHRETGRIFKVTYGTPEPVADVSLAEMSIDELLDLQNHSNEWYVRQSRRVLQELVPSGRVHNSYLDLMHNFEIARILEDVISSIRHLQTLYVIGAVDDAWMEDHLDKSEPRLQDALLRLIVDDGEVSDRAIELMAELAGRTESGTTFTTLASCLSRIQPVSRRWPLAEALATHAQTEHNPNLIRLVWYGIEPMVPDDPASAVELLAKCEDPNLTRFIARRLTHELNRHPEAVNSVVERMLEADATWNAQVLQGMAEALRGWRQATMPAAWETASSAAIAAAGDSEHADDIEQLVRELSVVFGDGRAVDELLQIAVDDGQEIASRQSAIRALVEARSDGMIDMLQDLLDHRELSADAIRGLAVIDDPATPSLIVEQYGRLYPPGRAEAITTLVSRPAYAPALLDAVEDGTIDRDDIESFQLRQMLTYGDEALSDRIRQLWPELEQLSQEKTDLIARYRDELTEDVIASGDLPHGRLLWQNGCAKCHRLFGEGGTTAPDLTGAQRSNLNYLLENIIDPSLQVSKNFHMSVLALVDGRILNGIVLEETEQTLVLQTPTERMTLRHDEVDERRETELSLMPEGQLDRMSSEEVRDLIAYLMSPAQVPLRE